VTGTQPGRLAELTTAESIALLGGVSFGRIVFAQRALLAVRPVNHLIDGGAVVIRTHLGAAALSAVGMVVAYEADAIDPDDHTGWCVVVTGMARLVREPEVVARYERLLRPWVSGQMDHVIRIRPEIVTGYRLVDGTAK